MKREEEEERRKDEEEKRRREEEEEEARVRAEKGIVTMEEFEMATARYCLS